MRKRSPLREGLAPLSREKEVHKMTKSLKDLAKQRKAVEEARKATDNETRRNPLSYQTEKVKELDFTGFRQIGGNHKNMSSSVKGEGALTIVYHQKCGRRIHLANEIWRDLDCPKYVNTYINGNQFLIVASDKHGIAVKFDRTIDFSKAVESYKSKIVLYAANVAKELAMEWNLPFDDFCCFTCGTYENCMINGVPAVVVTNENMYENTEVENTEVEDTEVENTEVEDTEADESQSEN